SPPPGAKPASVPPSPSPSPSATRPASPARPSSTPSASGAPPPQYTPRGTRTQQAFISLVAPGAIAAQQRYGVPAAVPIAQAIEESAWGRSGLAAKYHNLFGIKGSGPAGSGRRATPPDAGGQGGAK